jgi:RHS repeat-associated protein
VETRKGDPGGVRSVTRQVFFRGMDGDKLPDKDGKEVPPREVWVEDSEKVKVRDHEALAGTVREETVLNGVGGALVSSTISDPWRHGPTATSGPLKSWFTGVAKTRTKTPKAGGGIRWTSTATQYQNDTGLPYEVDDRGDESTAADDQCTTTDYVRNDGLHLRDKVSRTQTVGVHCDVAVKPTDVISEEKLYYDKPDAAHGRVLTKGDVVKKEQLRELAGATRKYDVVERSLYDANGRVTDVWDGNNQLTKTRYTPVLAGPVTQTVVTNPLNQNVTTSMVPALQLPRTTKDPNDVVTTLAYDGMGRLLRAWLAGRSTGKPADLSYEYKVKNTAPSAVVTRKLLPNGTDYKTSITLYDGWSRERQVQTQSPAGGRVLSDTGYDSRGLKVWTSTDHYDKSGTAPNETLVTTVGQPVIPSTTEFVHDGAERVVAEILKAQGAEKWRTTTTYDGERTTVVPPEGGTATTTVVDAHDRTVEFRQYRERSKAGSDNDADYEKTTYGWTGGGETAWVKDPAKNVWKYTYDLRGRKVVDVDPDRGETRMGYDGQENEISVSDSRGVTLFTEYDGIGRKKTVREGTPEGKPGRLRAEWTYDSVKYGIGKPASSVRYDTAGNRFTTEVTAYDVAGRATGTKVTVPATPLTVGVSGSWTFGTEYKEDGQTAKTSVPAVGGLPAEDIIQNYNSVGAPTTMLSAQQVYLYQVGYDQVGQLTERQLGNFAKRTQLLYTIDEYTGRLTQTQAKRSNLSDALLLRYDYDAAGNLNRIRDTTEGQSADTQCYRYDHLRRLTKAWTPTSAECAPDPTPEALGGPAKYLQSFEYDVTGSRTKESRRTAEGEFTRTYAYPTAGEGVVQPHGVTGVQTKSGDVVTSDATYGYDPAGNTDERTIDGRKQVLSWDAEGKLAAVDTAGKISEYLYDADGNRLITKDSTGTTLFLPGGTELKVSAAGTSPVGTRYYTHLDVPVAVRTGGTGLSWILTDHHNTAELQLGRDDLAVNRRRTLPFGDPRGAAAVGWIGERGFVNGLVEDTGLIQIGARAYDPGLGRFVSVDPVIDHEDPQQLNGYAYSNNAPPTFTDPDGLLFGSLWNKAKDAAGSYGAKAADVAGNAVKAVAETTWNVAKDTVQSIKEDPLKFAAEMAVGALVTVAVAGVCATGVGCLILAGAAAGAAAAGASYGVDVAQGEKEFSAGDLATEMAVGGIAGAAGGALGAGGRKIGERVIGGRKTAQQLERAAEKARNALMNNKGTNWAMTYTGAWNRKTGQVAAGYSGRGTGGCAEQCAQGALGLKDRAVQFTRALGWRGPSGGKKALTQIPICKNCQKRYSPRQFPRGVSAAPGGQWSSSFYWRLQYLIRKNLF